MWGVKSKIEVFLRKLSRSSVLHGDMAPRNPIHLQGMFNQRPPAPCCRTVWSVDTVNEYIQSHLSLVYLYLKDLSMKLVMLLANSNASRASDLASVSNSSQKPYPLLISFWKPHKPDTSASKDKWAPHQGRHQHRNFQSTFIMIKSSSFISCKDARGAVNILDMAGWFQKSTFERFDYKPVESLWDLQFHESCWCTLQYYAIPYRQPENYVKVYTLIPK